jgi:hypothetical protein
MWPKVDTLRPDHPSRPRQVRPQRRSGTICAQSGTVGIRTSGACSGTSFSCSRQTFRRGPLQPTATATGHRASGCCSLLIATHVGAADNAVRKRHSLAEWWKLAATPAGMDAHTRTPGDDGGGFDGWRLGRWRVGWSPVAAGTSRFTQSWVAAFAHAKLRCGRRCPGPGAHAAIRRAWARFLVKTASKSCYFSAFSGGVQTGVDGPLSILAI